MAANRVKIIDRDRGAKALVKRIGEGTGGRAVTVGVHDGEGGAPAGGGSLSVADVASVHEFGLGTAPERSFVRAWEEENTAKNADVFRKLAESVVKGANTVDTALDKAGLYFAASMQKRIQSGGVQPPLSQATINRKGSSTPLIDTGQLVSSITHKVE
jgi:hypothetical protein